MTAERRLARRFSITGRVQGVGFRPYVYRLATELGLAGTVGNDAAGVFLTVEGPAPAVEAFTRRLPAELPPLAAITTLEASDETPTGRCGFVIEASRAGGRPDVEVTPDAATCPDCRAELFDDGDRRHGYPFINCTNCGPRYSIVRGIPYDRATTTMASFPMCEACRAEYEDPANRRFHAQPNACPVCGPRMWLVGRDGTPVDGPVVATVAARLGEGAIVAVKGLGGFHLACRVDDDDVVVELRRLKGRESKPLAMMVPSVAAADELAVVDEASRQALLASARPIVLCPKRAGAPVAEAVAPGTGSFGLMLPYTPLHDLVLAAWGRPLVMTSGNPTAEPLCHDNDEALARLGAIADLFLLHDRDIARPVDDSVVVAVAGTTVPVRRARGYVPMALTVPCSAERPVLAVGGDLKSAVCVLDGTRAVLGEHLGELQNPTAFRHFVAAAETLQDLLQVRPRVVACDGHPQYMSARHARALGLPLVEVQHHHAHVVSCMAEHGLTGPTVGVACDGTGYGTDGSIWGCEILLCDEVDFERRGWLRTYRLPGGDAAAREPWRPALGLLVEAFGPDEVDRLVGSSSSTTTGFDGVDGAAVALARQRLVGGRLPVTSSLGRLFDAVAFLLGLCRRNAHEAQAAMALEAAADEAGDVEPLAYRIERDEGERFVLDVRPTMVDIVGARRDGRPVAEVARAFHETVAAMLADGADRACAAAGLDRVVLSGGCFVNRRLTERTVVLLRARGREPYVHRRVPTGDGGVALGQAVVAAARMAKGLI